MPGRRWVLFLVLVVLSAAGGAACSGGGVDLVAAADATRAEGTARVVASTETRSNAPGVDNGFLPKDYTGQVDFTLDRARLESALLGYAFDGPTLLQASFAPDQPGEVAWIELPMRLGPFAVGTVPDPFLLLDLVAAADGLTVSQGSETIDGISTERVRMEGAFGELLPAESLQDAMGFGDGPGGQQLVQQFGEALLAGTIRLDVWIDDVGRVMQVLFQYDTKTMIEAMVAGTGVVGAAQAQLDQMSSVQVLQLRFLDFGEPVDIVVPEATVLLEEVVNDFVDVVTDDGGFVGTTSDPRADDGFVGTTSDPGADNG